MEKENVIQKIQKLLKLQYGAESIGSTGEAYQAAKMVRKLLMEYSEGNGKGKVVIDDGEEHEEEHDHEHEHDDDHVHE